MQLAAFKYEMPQLELKSLQTFLAIKRCQRTKIRKIIKQARSSKKKWSQICGHSGYAVNHKHNNHKHHHHGGAVCPSYGMGSMDTPDRTSVTSSEGVR